jgi:uncharacterized protein (TIGR02145 family)
MSNESLLFWVVLIVGFLLYLYFNNKFYQDRLKIFVDKSKELNKQGIEHEKNNKSEIEINGVIWMTKNLNADKYQNGEEVILCQTEEEWQQANEKKIPASCYYNFDQSVADQIGRLYNWYAVNDPRGLAPTGWKIPNSDDINELCNVSVDIFSLIVEGKSKNNASDLKSTLGWKKSEGGSNSLGLSFRPSGLKVFDRMNIIEYDTYDGCYEDSELDEICETGFIGLGTLAGIWSSTEESSKEAAALMITETSRILVFEKSDGLSVRCIKENAFVSTEKTTEKTNELNNPDEYKEKYIKLLEAEVERLKNEKK